MRVKDVINMTIEGIKVSSVIKTRIWSEIPYSDPLSLDVTNVRAGASTAKARPDDNKSNSALRKQTNLLAHTLAIVHRLNCIGSDASLSRN
jgi:hypothetical protein